MMIKLSRKDRTELVVTVALVVFFMMLLAVFFRKGKKFHSGSGRMSQGMFSAGRSFKYDPLRNKGAYFILDMAAGEIVEVRRDPFSFGSPDDAKAASAPDLFLSGIIWSSDNPSAVINDRILRAGETIGGFKVVRISQDCAVLEDKNSSLELKLSQ